MSDLSMSQFLNREDFQKAIAEEATQVQAKPGCLTATRLVCGVELRLVDTGKHWTLSAQKR
jgi:hypothetical protein